jgi:hypothetical protein
MNNVCITSLKGRVKCLTPEPRINKFRPSTASINQASTHDIFKTELPLPPEEEISWTETPSSVSVRNYSPIPFMYRFRTRHGFKPPNLRETKSRSGTPVMYEKPLLKL